MENFDDLQNLWNRSASGATTTASELIKKAEAHIKRIKASQRVTIAILSTLTAVLIGYFIWVGAHRLNALTVGLSVMIGVIFVRIILEWISVNRFNAIKPDSSMIEFSGKMSRFYSWRRRVHILFVPLIYLSYTLGFTLLLPAFKENLSPGLYLYVLISGFGSLIVLALVIVRYIKKETQVLNLLKSIYTSNV